MNPFIRLFADKISFNIKEIKVNGNYANATFEVTAPDLSEAAADIIGIAFASEFGANIDAKAMEKMITQKLKDKSFPKITDTTTYDLIKDKEGWRIFFNWEGQIKAIEVSEEATQLEKNNRYEEAKIKYHEALSLDKNNKTIQEKISELDVKIEEYKSKKDYFDKIEVRDIQIDTGHIFSNINVLGEIKNNGDKTLKEVEITIYCLDENDKAVYEKIQYPILDSEYSSINVRAPLKPNYSRKFDYNLDEAPSDWSKKVMIKVTNIEFQ